MIILKSVFIIAIVAISMIGMMVPSVTATHDKRVSIHMFELCTQYGNLDLENKLCTLTKDVPETVQVGTSISSTSLSTNPSQTTSEWKNLKIEGMKYYNTIVGHETTQTLGFDKFTIDGNGHSIIVSNKQCDPSSGNMYAIDVNNHNNPADSLILKNFQIDGSDYNCKSSPSNSIINLYGICCGGGLTVLNSEIYGTTGQGIAIQGQLILKNSFIHDIKQGDYGMANGVGVSYENGQDSESIIENNKISNTGIATGGNNFFRITNNEISNNDIGVSGKWKWKAGTGEGIISNNIFKNNKIAIDTEGQTISDNEFINNEKNSSDKRNNWVIDVKNYVPSETTSSISSKFPLELDNNDAFPVTIDVTMTKNNLEDGEPISFELNVDPPVPNTPLTVSLTHDSFYMSGNQLIPKSLETKDFTMMSASIQNFNDDGYFEETGNTLLTIYPKNIPSGKYLLKIEFGSNNKLLGKQMELITFTNNDNSIVSKYIDDYFPNYLDVGTSVDIVDNSKTGFTLKYGDKLFDFCKGLECKTFANQEYILDGDSYVLTLYEFKTQTDAKKYGSISFDWDGAPSSRGNYDAVMHTSLINDEFQQCFEYDGGFYSANGVDGLLKCTTGNFVAEISNTDNFSYTLVNSMSDKIHLDIKDEFINTITPLDKHIPEEISSTHIANNQCGEGTILKNNVCVLEITCGEGTIMKNGQCVVDNSSSGGGCLIATATYGSEMSQQVQQLRELRDNQLLQTESGTAFMGTFNHIYYSFSPIIADYERENTYFKEAVKIAITPMISSLSLMESANSESEVLGMGLSVIMLNIGMYLGVPAVVIVGIRKRI
jgi:hypothetical protein